MSLKTMMIVGAMISMMDTFTKVLSGKWRDRYSNSSYHQNIDTFLKNKKRRKRH